MIYTTYFANLKNLDKTVSCPISISGKSPNWYRGLEYKRLAPQYWFFKEYKDNPNEDLYTKRFRENVLRFLKVEDVLNDFRVLINNRYLRGVADEIEWWNKIPFNIYLTCYENPSRFCHRHIVADWFCEKGVKVSEIS